MHFVDFQGKNSLKKYYQSADVFILPTREDIWGLVINEAMANGLPIITTDRCIAGLELVSPNENGYIVPVNNINSLREAIYAIFQDETTLGEMSNVSLRKIGGYTIEKMVAAHLEKLK